MSKISSLLHVSRRQKLVPVVQFEFGENFSRVSGWAVIETREIVITSKIEKRFPGCITAI